MAERLHQLSYRQLKPFIIIDPTTLPENLRKSELFGYEKGAFTGLTNGDVLNSLIREPYLLMKSVKCRKPSKPSC
ncbi:MAG: sigma 54-interacting transcriptional regulator [Desulfobacterales bacterium]